MKLKISFYLFIIAVINSAYSSDTTLFFQTTRFDKGAKISPPMLESKLVAYVPVATYSIQSGSSSLPLSFMSAFAFGGSITSNEMSSYEKLLNDNNRLGYVQNYSLSLYPSMFGSEKQTEANFQIEIESMAGLLFKRDAFRMFMQGNTPYLGKELMAGKLIFEQWRNRIFRFNLKSYGWNGWLIYPSIQLSQNLSFSKVETNGLRLYSSPTGDSLSFNGSGYLANANYSFWGNGFGVQGGFLAQKTIVNASSKFRKIVGFGIKNFGIYSLSEVNTQSRNAVWDASTGISPASFYESKSINLTAVNIPANDLQVSNWLNRQKDSVNSKLNIAEIKRSGYVLSPYQVNAFLYFQKLNTPNAILHRIQLNYIHFTGYLPYLSYSIVKQIRSSISLNGKATKSINFGFYGGVSFGGFDNFDINSGLQFPLKPLRGLNKSSLLNIQFYGIESFVVPSLFHGAGASIRWLLLI